ncbi:MAG: pyrimidine 5'-nucleotidase [Alphaproteobacteria bacterium]|nr:MAG: pyrimidine 5'-nucleotidase [Alphaproteobacteria bacterium]
MPAKDFQDVRAWVFDLDNTLYPPSARLFDQIEVRMTRFVMDALGVDHARADALRRDYWRRYGTTLAGLMDEHGVDPDPYLNEVHEISLEALRPDPALARAIGALPGRRIVYTNGSAGYARRVLAARGLDGVFDAVFGVEHAGYRPKPERSAFERVFAAAGIDPGKGAMFEDDARNLAAPHAMGMRTVHVAPSPEPAPHVHHHTDDLTAFLERIAPPAGPGLDSGPGRADWRSRPDAQTWPRGEGRK